MSRSTNGSRWSTPGRRYAGGWRENPWINAMCNAVHARSETGDVASASADADSAADQQQRAAVKTWENEGGSLDTHPAMSR